MLWTTAILPLLLSNSNAQLTAPSKPVCPGDRIIFTCNQDGTFTRWTINLSSRMIQTNARSTQVGSELVFNDHDPFHFEIHVLSNSSNTLTTQLQVTATRGLNGVTVQCSGANEGNDYISAIQVASIAAPSGVKKTYDRFTKIGASINVTWSTSRGADNYTVRVTPPINPGQISDFATTNTSLQLMLMYDVDYSINITAHLSNCVGSNSTIVPLIVVGCSPPSPPLNGTINDYASGSVGALLTFQCNTGYIPQEQAVSTCLENGSWVPIPHCMLADCGIPSPATGVVIEPFSSTQFDATIIYHCEEGLIPDTIIEAVCGSTGVWNPDPAYHLCINQSFVSCDAPVVPIDAHISNQSDRFYQEGANVTFQCVNGSQALLTTTCHANGDWNPPPSELDCNPSANVRKELSTSTQVILAAVICSFVFFLFGILVGALCHHWATVFIKPCNIKRSNGTIHEHPTLTDTPEDVAPVVYEEVTSGSPHRQRIELKENVAYGPI